MNEKYILVAVATDGEEAAERSLDELEALLETAGGEAASYVIQNLPHPDNATYVGSGKAEELRELITIQDADGILCDDELSPVQIRKLTEITGAKVIDRTILILDIFAAHAGTKEGKLQTEMAQLKYRASHLAGIGKELSRQGGGIGTRGPGETKLETDRRAIRSRIGTLNREIQEMKKVRQTTRKKRSGDMIPTVALVGYTNAGKSTLLNALTGADVLAEDKLFATLDPTTRVARLTEGQEILFTDTVGFINKLPHNLIDAFRSTLEEAGYADYIVHVIDASDENEPIHTQTVYRTLDELQISGKPVLAVFNKSDIVQSDIKHDPRADKSVTISAKTGAGIDRFWEALQEMIRESRRYLDEVVPYADGSRMARIRKYGQVLSEEYEAEGIHVKAYVPSGI